MSCPLQPLNIEDPEYFHMLDHFVHMKVCVMLPLSSTYSLATFMQCNYISDIHTCILFVWLAKQHIITFGRYQCQVLAIFGITTFTSIKKAS